MRRNGCYGVAEQRRRSGIGITPLWIRRTTDAHRKTAMAALVITLCAVGAAAQAVENADTPSERCTKTFCRYEGPWQDGDRGGDESVGGTRRPRMRMPQGLTGWSRAERSADTGIDTSSLTSAGHARSPMTASKIDTHPVNG